MLYYPLAALLGIKLLALASISAAALAFAIIVGREWGPLARCSSRSFGILWAGTALSAAFPFSLGAALALFALWALQDGHRRRFALLVLLTLAASPLAFALLAVVLAGLFVGRRPPPRRVLLPAAAVVSAALLELLLVRLFPDGGRFPFHAGELVPAACFCALGALAARRAGATVLIGSFVAYLGAIVISFAVPSALGANIERLRYAAVPLALLAAALARWRPLYLVAPLVAVAAFWNISPLVGNLRHALADPSAASAYWSPAVTFLRPRLTPSYRVEVVDTLQHWPAVHLPNAGIPIVRGWYRQNDFPTNRILYGRFGPAAYRGWLRSMGVRFVVLSDAPVDYSSRAEAALLQRGVEGLRPVLRSQHLSVYEFRDAQPLVTGPGPANVVRMLPSRLFIHVGAAGEYRVAVRFSPYWRTFQGCVAPTRDGMTRLTAFRAGIVDLDFKANVHRGVEVLTGRKPSRFCRA